MNLIRGRRGWVESMSVLALLISAMACGRSEPVKSGSETPAEYPLPKEGDPIKLADFKKFVDFYYQGTPHTQNRDGFAGTATCKKCVKVEIHSIGLTTDIDETKAPAKDRVVAQMQCTIDKKDTTVMYRIVPMDKADHYLWVHGAGGRTRWTVVGLEKQPGGMAVAHLVATGMFDRCAYEGITKVSEADFKSCKSAHPIATPNKSALGADAWIGLLGASLRKIFRTQDTSMITPEYPAWLRCLNGCCTA